MDESLCSNGKRRSHLSQQSCRHQAQACLTWSNIVAPTLARWKKPACLLSVRFRTAASISIITTLPLTRSTRSSPKSWRKIQLSSRSLHMRLRTWSNRYLVERNVQRQRRVFNFQPGGKTPQEMRFPCEQALKARFKLPTLPIE